MGESRGMCTWMGMQMNLYDSVPDCFPEELTQILHQSGSIRIERIVSCGQVTPDDFWYDQDEEEWIVLLEGEAVLLMEPGKTISLRKGETLLIPPHQKHKVIHTSCEPQCIWLCVFIGQNGS